MTDIVPAGYVKERMVVCAAIAYPDSGLILLGVRHNDHFMEVQRQANRLLAHGKRQSGFIDQKGVFLTRAEAWKVAEAAGQIRNRWSEDGDLYSENLY